MATLPRPTVVKPSETIHPRTFNDGLLPLLPPPEFSNPASYPSLPPHRTSSDTALPGYKCTTHILPAAYPRAPSRAFPPPKPLGRKLEKTEIKETVNYLAQRKEESEKLRTAEEVEASAKVEGRKEVLWIVAKRYKHLLRKAKPEGKQLTLIALHGIGVSKEVGIHI